ncbi:PIR protein [Plasmodium vivax]|nr:PIR protein [Plasmodium vivax]
MATGSPEPWYLNYDEYAYLRDKFNPERVPPFSTDTFNTVINNTTDDAGKIKYNKIFREIFRHINNNNVFIYYDGAKACNYISYILHKELENKSDVKYDEVTYSATKKFVQEYKKERGYSNQYCESKMFYIDSNMYEKMKYLYLLYDMYYEYTKKNFGNDYAKKCNTLGYAMQYHNKIIDYYQDDEDLVKKSLIMKNLIEKLQLQPSDECNYKIRELKKSKLQLEREKKQSEADTKAPEQEESLKALVGDSGSRTIIAPEGRTDIQEQQKQVESAHGHQELQEHQNYSGTIDHLKEPQFRAESVDHRRTVHNQLSRQYGHPSHDELSVPNIVSGRYPKPGYYRESGYSYDTELENKLGSVEERNIISGDPLSSASEGRGFIHNVKDTISGIIGGVDPIPVVGVSGGMGALFLLFRYTPVGTFFRGGRGRVHRIPRSFNGPFPDIQDYDGGYIGYGPTSISSLAE